MAFLVKQVFYILRIASCKKASFNLPVTYVTYVKLRQDLAGPLSMRYSNHPRTSYTILFRSDPKHPAVFLITICSLIHTNTLFLNMRLSFSLHFINIFLIS